MLKAILAGLIVGVMAVIGIWIVDAEACACAPVTAAKVPNQDCLTGLSYPETGNCVSPDSAEEMQLLLHNLPAEKRYAMADSAKLPHSPNGYMYSDNYELVTTNPEFVLWYVNTHLGDAARFYRGDRGLLPTEPYGFYYNEDYSLSPIRVNGRAIGGS